MFIDKNIYIPEKFLNELILCEHSSDYGNMYKKYNFQRAKNYVFHTLNINKHGRVLYPLPIYNQKNYSIEKKIDNHRNYYLDYIKNQP